METPVGHRAGTTPEPRDEQMDQGQTVEYVRAYLHENFGVPFAGSVSFQQSPFQSPWVPPPHIHNCLFLGEPPHRRHPPPNEFTHRHLCMPPHLLGLPSAALL